MNSAIQGKIDNWKFHRGLALDILKSLTDEQLLLTVGKNMGTLGEQFRHMARVQVQYTEAIKNKKIGPTEKKPDLSSAGSKDQLMKILEDVDKEMMATIEGLLDEVVEELKIDWQYWGVQSLSLPEHLQALTDHECLHNGQIIVYLKTHEIPFPKSWEAWGL